MSTPGKNPRRVAVVTGGTGGLGLAICQALVEAGHHVIAADIRMTLPEESAAMRDQGIEDWSLDVTDFDACGDFVADVEKQHGRLDILINAAGITRDLTLRNMSRTDWDAVLDVNLNGAFNVTRHALDLMLIAGYGRIVNISSVNGQTGQFGQTNYSAAKAGLHGFTMALARETARKGVTVNSISPGYCETPLVMRMPEEIRAKIIESVPMGRLGQPGEIARAVRFLTDDEAGFITGANLPVNGGLFISF